MKCPLPTLDLYLNADSDQERDEHLSLIQEAFGPIDEGDFDEAVELVRSGQRDAARALIVPPTPEDLLAAWEAKPPSPASTGRRQPPETTMERLGGAPVPARVQDVLSESDMASWLYHQGHLQDLRAVNDEGIFREFIPDHGYMLVLTKEMHERLYARYRGQLSTKTRKGQVVENPQREGQMTFKRAVTASIAAIAHLPTRAADWDSDPCLIGLPGGLKLDLLSGRTSPRTRDDLLSHELAAAPSTQEEFDESRFRDFLWRQVPDAHSRLCLQVELGAALTGRPSPYLNILHGKRRSGKSTFAGLTQMAFGQRYASTLDISLLMKGASKQGSFDSASARAQLQGLRAAFLAEPEMEWKLADGLAKQIGGGGDRITGRRIGRDTFTFAQSHSLFVYGNNLPSPANADEALVDRIRIYPFDETRSEAEREDLLETAFQQQSELDAFVFWALQGARMFYERGRPPPSAAMLAAKAAWLDTKKTAEQPPDLWADFLDARCEHDDAYSVPARDLLPAFLHWLGEQHEAPPPFTGAPRLFGTMLRARHPDHARKGQAGRLVLYGTRLRD